MNTLDTVLLISFDDHADGQAYPAESKELPTAYALLEAIPMLKKHDHVCIIDKVDYENLTSRTYTAVSPYAINIWAGVNA